MVYLMKNFILLLIISFNAVAAEEIIIKSNIKDAIVQILGKNGRAKTIGKTPLKTTLEVIKSGAENKSSAQIQIVKEGFRPYSLVVPLMEGIEMNIYGTLEVDHDVKFAQDVDLLVADLFDTLRMIRLKDYDSAFKKLDLLEKKFPQYSIIYEMRGMGYYLKKEFKKSLNFYRKAFGMNPKNREAYKMKNYLQKKFGLGD